MAIKLVTRAEWGARKPRQRTVGSLSGASTGHWNGPTLKVAGETSWDHSKCAALVRGIQNFHMDSNGWIDIAYNFLECPHGYTFEGRGLNVVNAANGVTSANRSSHAIMWLAGKENDFVKEERVGFRECVKYISLKTDAPDQAVGHRDHKSTECPGNDRYNWIRQGMVVDLTPQPVIGGFIVNGANRAQGGYALVGADGGVFSHDGAPFFGSLPGINVKPNAPIVSIAWTLDGGGYWLMGSDGGVYAFGNAPFRGSYPGLPNSIRNDPTRTFVAVIARSDGRYSLVSSKQEHYDF